MFAIYSVFNNLHLFYQAKKYLKAYFIVLIYLLPRVINIVFTFKKKQNYFDLTTSIFS